VIPSDEAAHFFEGKAELCTKKIHKDLAGAGNYPASGFAHNGAAAD